MNQNTENIKPLRDSIIEFMRNHGQDEEKFLELFESDEIKKKTNAHFVRSRDLGVRGFPSLILRIDDSYKFISYGYQKAGVLIQEIEALMD